MISRLLCSCIMMLLPFAECLGSNKDYGIVGNEVIAHYAKLGDKEKLRAAEFLVSNMQYHTFKHSPTLDSYYKRIEEINSKFKYPACVEQYNNLYKELGNPLVGIKVVKDADFMTSQDLINHIELAFDDWRNGIWARHLSFEDFCEYLLPYKLADEKPTKGWREELRKKFESRIRAIGTSDDMNTQSYWAAYYVNEELRTLRFKNQKVLPQFDLRLPVSSLKDMRMGECRDYATYTVYAMRACGIPVSLDFTPQWPDRAHNHYWNALRDNTGLSISFMGAESKPGYPSKEGRRMAKVYRQTFAYQPQSLYALNKDIGEKVPEILNSPFMKDVSNEYFVGRSITLKLNNAHKNDKFAYIAVFDNQQWVPVDFALISGDRTVTFKNLGSDIVYMPVYWGRNGCVPAGDPVLLDLNGTVKTLKPDYTKTQTLSLNRKYPQFNRIIKLRGLMKKGVFEAANLADFSDAKVCATIKKVPNIGYDTLDISTFKGKYRYWRYISPKGGKCNVAELKFINSDSKQMNIPKILSKGASLDNTKAENVFDNNELTYYASETAENGWVGVDMGKPVDIGKIVYLARNDDNDIVAGQIYELKYFENGRPRSAGIQRASSGTLTFKDVPSNTIYWLLNLDKGREERIFTYQNNKIYWY